MKEKDFLKQTIDHHMADKERIRLRVSVLASAENVKVGGTGMKKSTLKSFIAAFAAVALVLLGSVFAPMPLHSGSIAPGQINDYTDILQVIENFKKNYNNYNNNYMSYMMSGDSIQFKENMPVPTGTPSSSQDYSETNVQTAGMDEGDIVKTDGSYIYKLNTKGCVILEANSGDLTKRSTIAIDNYIPQELYISGNKLVMIGGIHQPYTSTPSGKAEPLYDCMIYWSYNKTDIRIYDITNRESPQIERQITLDGTYNTSRIMTENNKLFYMVDYSFYSNQEEDYIPTIEDSTMGDGAEMPIPAEDIYYYDDIANYTYLIMGQIDLDEPETGSLLSAYLGLSGTLYLSGENIYVATYDYHSRFRTNVWGGVTDVENTVSQTRIVKIALADLKQKAAGRVEGSLKDRYSLDEYQGFLRVATTSQVYGGNFSTYQNIFVLKPDLTVAGKIQNIAPGETIYSVRFNGETGSLVTFRQMDPLYKLNLADPFNPTISEGLKEDGVSYYIHYIEGTDYTIGVGMDSRLEGMGTVWTGLKVSLYDNSGTEAVNVKTITIPGSCHSDLFYNPKALLYDAELGLFAFSYENWQYDNNYYHYRSMTQGLAVFRFDTDAANDSDKLVLQGTLSNLQNEVDIANRGFSGSDGYYDRYFSFITRGLRLGNHIYTISDKYVTSYTLADLTQVEKIEL